MRETCNDALCLTLVSGACELGRSELKKKIVNYTKGYSVVFYLRVLDDGSLLFLLFLSSL